MIIPRLSQSRVKELLDYDPETGELIWRIKSARNKAGDVAGYINNCNGYVFVGIKGVKYQAHLLIWLWMTGEWPKRVDHRNTMRSDNRWENLREATHQQNQANRGRNKNNTSGLKGVTWCKRDKVYYSQIMVNYKRMHLGTYKCPAAAHLAYIVAADKIFGDFARAR